MVHTVMVARDKALVGSVVDARAHGLIFKNGECIECASRLVLPRVLRVHWIRASWGDTVDGATDTLCA